MPTKNPTPGQKRRWNWATRYGLTPADLKRMHTEQGGKCGICGEPLKDFRVDHCHASGKVRGLLCHHCNLKLAVVEDMAFVMLAWAYLDERG